MYWCNCNIYAICVYIYTHMEYILHLHINLSGLTIHHSTVIFSSLLQIFLLWEPSPSSVAWKSTKNGRFFLKRPLKRSKSPEMILTYFQYCTSLGSNGLYLHGGLSYSTKNCFSPDVSGETWWNQPSTARPLLSTNAELRHHSHLLLHQGLKFS